LEKRKRPLEQIGLFVIRTVIKFEFLISGWNTGKGWPDILQVTPGDKRIGRWLPERQLLVTV